ncbi:hypothetical protein EXU48_05800 [Occultella glacieicola]|uniref:DUF1616 domain-containing protein n=1 Tax=Occultella glacieicola TaxID=2518684 RepID=A0ABY2E5B3_9MICO|nr:hypothetical protein [Occultella glacieicola]TDE95778.1 hypothetical protein EXU48_05800 [Occultella glacieicola]
MLVRWTLTVAFALVVAAAVGAVAAVFNPDAPLLTGVVFAAATLGPAGALGWFLFVSPKTAAPDPNAEDNVENTWLEKAAAAAFVDLLVLLSLALTAVSVSGRSPDPQLLLLGAVVVAMGDVAIRYVIAARRER